LDRFGAYGRGDGKRLLKQGCDLSVWNRTRSKAEPLVEYGAKLVDGKPDLAGCDIVFTMCRPRTTSRKSCSATWPALLCRPP